MKHNDETMHHMKIRIKPYKLSIQIRYEESSCERGKKLNKNVK